jgi:hypothetical protein
VRSAFCTLAHLTNVVLRVEIKAKLGNEVELSLQEIDMMLFVVHQLPEEVTCHVIFDGVTMSGELFVKCARIKRDNSVPYQARYFALAVVGAMLLLKSYRLSGAIARGAMCALRLKSALGRPRSPMSRPNRYHLIATHIGPTHAIATARKCQSVKFSIIENT